MCPLKSALWLELYASAGASEYESMGVLAFCALGQEVSVVGGGREVLGPGCVVQPELSDEVWPAL